MSFSARYSFAILIVVLSLSASPSGQTTTKQAGKVPRGSISGRVTIKESGAPGVVVGIRKGEMSIPPEPVKRTTTDQEGLYRISNLPPGNYSVTISAPAYVMAGSRDITPKNVLVGEDENVDGINFTLVRGGVITGRLTDSEGRPIIDHQVDIFPAQMFDKGGVREMYSPVSVQTDDRGVYRAYGLKAGRYKVCSGRSEDFTGYYKTRNASYRQVFYPSVTDSEKASVIEVSEGSEATGVDITLAGPEQTFAVGGRAINPATNSPAANIKLGLQLNTDEGFQVLSTRATSNSRGEFWFEGLTPGRYIIHLVPSPGDELRAEPLGFEIKHEDVGGLTVKIAKGASVSGNVILESEEKTAFAKLLELQLRALPAGPTGGVFMPGGTAAIASDGSFRIGGLPAGTMSLVLGSRANILSAKGFTILRLERDGVVMPGDLELKEGEQVTGVRLVVAYGNATLRGVIKLENGSLPEGARIFGRLTKAGEKYSNLPNLRVDTRGHFQVEGLPTGNYEVWAFLTGGNVRLKNIVKRPVTLRHGEVTEIVITIDLSADVQP